MGDGNTCIVFCCFIVIVALIMGALFGFDKILLAIGVIFGGLAG